MKNINGRLVMKRLVKLSAGLLAIMLMASLAACGTTAPSAPTSAAPAEAAASTTAPTTAAPASTTSATDTSESAAPASPALSPVTLTYYVPEMNTITNLQPAQDAINVALKEKINATLDMHIISYGDYAQKMNVTLAAGTPVDIMWSAYSMAGFTYNTLAASGAFVDSGALFQQYAPKTWASLEPYWDGMKVNGKIYGMPNEMMWAQESGFQINQKYADQVGFTDEADKIINIADIEPYLAKVKSDCPGVTPLALKGNSGLLSMYAAEPSMGLWNINQYGCIKDGDASLSVLSFFESQEFMDRCALAHKWYGLGYINKDAATLTDVTPLQPQSFAIYSPTHINCGIEKMESKQQPWGGPFFFTAASETFMPANAPQTSAQCIGSNSKNPERAAMFLELTHSDPDFIHLFCYGVEGVNYTVSDDGIYMTPIKDSGYGLSDWLNINCHMKLLAVGQQPDAIQKEIDANNSAAKPGFFGFVYDPTKEKDDIANAAAVVTQYLPGLITGTVDPASTIPTFVDKLKAAGLDKIIADTQDQINAWRTANGK